MNVLITNNILLPALCSWAIAQIAKVIVVLLRDKRLDLRYLFISGGMPSSHAALVTALAASIAITEGFGSVAFSIATVFALIVLYDAAGVRQSVGEQSIALNRILQELREQRPLAEVGRDIREFLGHTEFQVFMGTIIGIGVAWFWQVVIAG
ncbi:divergent PAP2 family protein [Chloroflexota bacterium]